MGALTAHFDVPLGDESPRRARAAVASVLAVWGYTDRGWCHDLAVVVSELVTNAVQHGGGLIVMELQAAGECVEVSVADGSSVVPRRREPDGRGGRGLMLLETLTARWYVENHEGGKRVRAELHPYPGSIPAAAGSSRTVHA